MKRYKTANLIFMGAFLLLAAAVMFRHFSDTEGGALFYFLAQSCFIGCFADWFAIEALFRNRLSIPGFQPLVPKNKETVIRRLQETVNGKLIKSDSFASMIQEFSISDFIENKYRKENSSVQNMERKGAIYIGRFFVEFLESHKQDISLHVRQSGEEFIRRLVPYLQNRILAEGKSETVLNRILEEAEKQMRSPSVKAEILNYLKKWGESQERGVLGNLFYSVVKSIGVINYEDMAESVVEALEEQISNWKDKDHPFHQALLREWNDSVASFMENPSAKKALNDFIFYLYQSIPVEEKTDSIFENIWNEWVENGAFETRLVPQLEKSLRQAVRAASENKDLRRSIDWSAKNLLMDILKFEHKHISAIITDILQNYKTEELNEFIESKVHKELESIRINGAAVGLAAGAALYGFIEFIYLPILKVTGLL